MLAHTPVYFDDLDFIFNHKWGGELLAIEEFNKTCDVVKIDRWYNIGFDKPFSEAYFWQKMMVAHDLEAINNSQLTACGADNLQEKGKIVECSSG